jgi:hypothetical protein
VEAGALQDEPRGRRVAQRNPCRIRNARLDRRGPRPRCSHVFRTRPIERRITRPRRTRAPLGRAKSPANRALIIRPNEAVVALTRCTRGRGAASCGPALPVPRPTLKPIWGHKMGTHRRTWPSNQRERPAFAGLFPKRLKGLEPSTFCMASVPSSEPAGTRLGCVCPTRGRLVRFGIRIDVGRQRWRRGRYSVARPRRRAGGG